jgi:chromosome segregation ATPase
VKILTLQAETHQMDVEEKVEEARKLQVELKQCKEDDEKLRSDLDAGGQAHQAEVRELQRQLKEKTDQYEEVRRKLEKVESDLKSWKEQYNLIFDQCMKNQTDLEVAEKKINDCEELIKDYKRKVKEYKERLESLEDELADISQPDHHTSSADACESRTVKVETEAAEG